MKTRYCKNCLFPETKPDLYFDKNGVCDACISAERKHGKSNSVDWKVKNKFFNELLDKARKKSNFYNCIVPGSGGKDSTWQVYAMKHIHKMNPLVVTFDQFDQTGLGIRNLEALKSIGVDHIHFSLNPNIVKLLVKKGFEIVGDPYWVNHVGIFSVPMHVANNFNIPLVVYGENPIFEYGGPIKDRDNYIFDKRWRQELGGMRGLREEDMLDSEIKLDDIKILLWPDEKELKKKGILGTFYGSFFKWEPQKHTEFVKKFGWKERKEAQSGSYLKTENCDMEFIDIRERIKFLKYGYGRATDQLNILIRQKKISRLKALKIVKKIDGKVDKKNIKKFCNYLGITITKYENIVDSFVNHEIFVKDNKGEWRLKFERD